MIAIGHQDEQFEEFSHVSLQHWASARIVTRHRPRGSAQVALVQPLAHFLAGLEERHGLLLDIDMDAGARVATHAGIAPLH